MKKLALLTCNNYIKELQIVLKNEGIEDVEFSCIPCACYKANSKDKTVNRKIIEKLAAKAQTTKLLLPKECVGFDISTEMPSCQFVAMRNCFEMFLPTNELNQLVRNKNYLISQAWLANWKEFVYKRWGFNEENVSDFFKEFSEQIALLDTGLNQNSNQLLSEFAEKINLPAQIIPLSLDYFTNYIKAFLNDSD